MVFFQKWLCFKNGFVKNVALFKKLLSLKSGIFFKSCIVSKVICFTNGIVSKVVFFQNLLCFKKWFNYLKYDRD